MTSSPHGLYVQGCTRATMACTKGSQPARGSQSQKTRPSSDCRLQLACMKVESLVIAGQQHCGECVPEPCTQLKGAWQPIELGGANPPRVVHYNVTCLRR